MISILPQVALLLDWAQQPVFKLGKLHHRIVHYFAVLILSSISIQDYVIFKTL